MKRFFLVISIFLTQVASAGFKGDVTFTDGEIRSHKRHLNVIIREARKHLLDTWDDHLAFYRRHGVSKYYGDRSVRLNTISKRRQALRRYSAPTSLASSLKPTSCIGLTLEALRKGFHKPGDPQLRSAWQKAERFTRANAVDGSALVHALQKLGWKILYWNPDPSGSRRWDAQEKNWRSKGWHFYRYLTVTRKGNYYFNKVDDARLLVGFGKNVPREFVEFPFFVGIAHTGYHVFPGFDGGIIEAHSTRRLNSIDNLERSVFNPFLRGGGPRWTRTEKYRSGIIAVPGTR